MQLLALFVLRTTLKQCENLTEDIFVDKLNVDYAEVEELIKLLYSERVIRIKYTFQCPKCGELNTVLENDVSSAENCQICGKKINIQGLISGATKRYVLDKTDFLEFMEENYEVQLEAARRGEKPDSNLLPFSYNIVSDNRESKMQSQRREKK